MRVDHFSGATMRVPFSPPTPAHVLVCHVDDGLVLVDAGVGAADLVSGNHRLGPMARLLRPGHDPGTTIAAQLRARGEDPEAVTDIVLTHLDLDHAGGVSDFPGARVHTTAEEAEAFVVRRSPKARLRYRPEQVPAVSALATHDGPGDEWLDGLRGHEILPGIVLVPMPGHTLGHAAVAVDAGERGWLVHAGDAAFDASVYLDRSPDGRELRPDRMIRAFEQGVAVDRGLVRRNHDTLRRLAARPDVTVFPAHDGRMLSALQAGGAASAT